MKWTVLDKVTYTLLVVGGLNWGLVGMFKFNLVDEIFGVESALSRIIYTLVGLASLCGIYKIVTMLAAAEEK